MTPTATDPTAPVYAQPNPKPPEDLDQPKKLADPPKPPPKSVPPKVLSTPEAQEAKKKLDEEAKEPPPPALSKLITDATTIPDEAAFQAAADKASLSHPNFRTTYDAYCKAEFGYVPLRLQNLADGNSYHLAAGPDDLRPLEPEPRIHRLLHAEPHQPRPGPHCE